MYWKATKLSKVGENLQMCPHFQVEHMITQSTWQFIEIYRKVIDQNRTKSLDFVLNDIYPESF